MIRALHAFVLAMVVAASLMVSGSVASAHTHPVRPELRARPVATPVVPVQLAPALRFDITWE